MVSGKRMPRKRDQKTFRSSFAKTKAVNIARPKNKIGGRNF